MQPVIGLAVKTQCTPVVVLALSVNVLLSCVCQSRAALGIPEEVLAPCQDHWTLRKALE